MLNILYEDNHLIAVFKPAGILVQGDESAEECLMDWVKKYLKEKYNKPGNVFLGLLHRLDRNVSGIVLFAKTSKGASRLSEQFRNRTILKEYHCLVEGKPKKEKQILVHYLLKDEEKNKVEVKENIFNGAQRAELEYEIIKTGDQHSLIKINLKTGRSHQIRAQMAAIGHPIVNDLKYGKIKIEEMDREIGLCSTKFVFKLATINEKKTIVIDYPKKWNKLLANRRGTLG